MGKLKKKNQDKSDHVTKLKKWNIEKRYSLKLYRDEHKKV